MEEWGIKRKVGGTVLDLTFPTEEAARHWIDINIPEHEQDRFETIRFEEELALAA